MYWKWAKWTFSLAPALVALSVSAEEPLEGLWQVTVSEVSQNCGDPTPPPSVLDVEIQRSGSFLVLLPEDPMPSLTELVGTVTGQSLALGFGVFENPGLTVYNSARNSLAIAQDLQSFSGDLPWRFYSGVDCSGLDNWSAVRLGTATEPNSLTGSWRVTLSDVSENCGDGLGSPAVFDVGAVQFGEGQVRFVPPAIPGLTEIVGTVTGQSLRIGLEVFEDEGITVYDSTSNNLVIAPDFDSFSGNLPWNFFYPFECSGVDHLEAVFVPEPDAGWLGLTALATLALCARQRPTCCAQR